MDVAVDHQSSPPLHSPLLTDRLTPLAYGAAALVLYLATLAPSITLANGAGDSGELASTPYTLGIAHPTGYPLYTMIAFVVTHLGRAEPAFLLNIFSAIMGALCIGLTCRVAIGVLNEGRPGGNTLLVSAAILAGVAPFALSYYLWTEATITETRTFALALDAGVLALLVVPRQLNGRRASAGALLYGLALCDHLLSLYLAPGIVLLIAPWAGRRVQRWLMVGGGVALGLIPYAYLPLRAAMNPVADWGHPTAPGSLLWVVSGAEYHDRMFGLDASTLLGRIGQSFALLGTEVPLPTVAAAIVGLVVLIRKPGMRSNGLALVTTIAIDIVLTSAYQADAAPAYLLLAQLCIALAASIGFFFVADSIRGVVSGVGRAGVAANAVILLGLVAITTWTPAAGASRAVAAARSTTTRDNAVNALRRLPRNAVILASGDAASVPLWYAQRGLGVRPDVTIVATSLLTFAWYDRELRRQPAFDPLLLPPADPRDDPSGLSDLARQRLTALVQAAASGHPVFLTEPTPALGFVCRQIFEPARAAFACLR